MNVERLHRVAQLVSDELSSLDLPGVVERLRNGLQSLSSNPADAQAAQMISDARTELERVLPDAPSNAWPPADRQILDEIGVSDILGDRLLERIEGILTRNEMTTSVALGEIEPIRDRLADVTRNLSSLLEGLQFFAIGMDDLVDDYEVGVAIPRGAVNNKLPDLGEEFVELQKILAPFEELAGQGRPAFEVRAIASSDFSIYLAALPPVAYGIAKAINEIEDAYIKWLDIKAKRAELAEKMPEERLSEIDAYINEVMEARLAELVDELVAASSATLDDGRRNELKIELNFSLNKLANRIDGGYSVDIRTPPPPDELAEEEEDEDARKERDQALATRELAAKIRRVGAPGKRILQLPEGSNDAATDS